MGKIIPLQQELSPALPNIYGAKDFREFKRTLVDIDAILRKSCIEDDLIEKTLLKYIKVNKLNASDYLSSKAADSHYRNLQYALRCNIARHLTGESYRQFSIKLTDSALLQWFTGINGFKKCKPASKSTLERFEKIFEENDIANCITSMICHLSNPENSEIYGIEKAVETDVVYADCTCVKSNIHFPVDWVLLRDAARSLLSAITTIRNQGLKHRMVTTAELSSEMSNLCIAMTHARGKKDGKKVRKTILRLMKKLINRIQKHAQRYRETLINNIEKTKWSEKQLNQVVKRIDNILNQLPSAMKQAHDRIIGERAIPSKDKILSLYEEDVQILVRGKAESKVEFGQKLLLVEQADGLIVDFDLYSDGTPADSSLVRSIISRLEGNFGKVSAIVGDRGFDSKSNDRFLYVKEIDNHLCPRSPNKLKEKMQGESFKNYQKRRAQTEGRIGVFKNVFLCNPLRTRSKINKRIAISWCVLSHNLWVTSRNILTTNDYAERLAA